jgi:FkbM family methyltransferase
MFSRDFHRKEFKALARLIRPGDIVFDVGANIGLVCVYMHRLCNPNGSIYAFEPVEDTFWMLMETLALNRCDSVRPLQLAISDRRGKITMNIFDRQHSEFNSLGRPTMPGLDGKKVRPNTIQEVPTDTLDHFCESQGIGHIDFLKVDVEGFEKQVFEGAHQLLRNRRIKSISFEISQDPLQGAGTKPCEVFEALEAFGYRSFRYNEVEDSFEGPVTDCSEYYEIFFASHDDFPGLSSAASKL